MLELLRKLCAIPGVSGSETPVAEYIRGEIGGAAQCRIDNMGNLIAFKKGAHRPRHRLMLCAHMDEVGLMVTFVNEQGLLKFAPVGGIDPRVILGRRVRIAKNGTPGVIATKAVHLQDAGERKTSPGIDKLYIDVGAQSQAEALACVQPGDTACFDSEFIQFGDGFIKARALDDRVGCAILLEVLRSDLPFDCTFAFTVQEEVGLRGAGPAAFGVQPDRAIVVESTTAADIPFVDEAQKVCFLGRGPVLSFMDGRTLYDRELFELARRTAEGKGIPCQVKQAVAGGNDAGAIHTAAGGIRTLAVSLPCRYLHSPACVIRRCDLDNSLRLVRELTGALAGD